MSNHPAGYRIPTPGGGFSTVRASFDFETYSEAGYLLGEKVRGVGSQGKGGLPVVGVAAYVEHPSFEVLSLAYDLKDGRGVRRWLPYTPYPLDLFAHITASREIEAVNVGFEWMVWNVYCVRVLGWPPLPLELCHCVAARSRRFNLPGSLAGASAVLGLGGKDKRGDDLIRKLTRPHTPTKARPSYRWTPSTAWGDFCALYEYNDRDVVAEDEVAERVPDLTPIEREVWLADQRINIRGVNVDRLTLAAALSVHQQAETRYTAELQQVTGGAVGSVSETAKFVQWLGDQGVHTYSIDKENVARMLAEELPPPARRALEIRELLGAANIKKLYALRNQLSSDGRLRYQYTYCGADRTGRWSAGGVQLQNMTAKGPATAICGDVNCGRYFGALHAGKGCPRCGAPEWAVTRLDKGDWPIEAVEQAIDDIRTGRLDWVERVWGDSIATMCGILRGLFTAADGKKLICVDFSSIEAVTQAFLARCAWREEVFRAPGECIYTLSASKITGTPVEEYKAYKAERGAHHPDRKNLGKVAELASGFGGWINAWKAFGADMPDDEIKASVLAWRDASPEIVEMWGGQFVHCGPGKWDYRPQLFGLEGAAIAAIQNPGQVYEYYDIAYHVEADILFCRLPSGRYLHYHRPRLTPAVDRLNRGPCVQITFEGYNSNAAKGPVGWHRMDTFGGRLFENVVQAAARDIQAEALLRAEAAGYTVVMHTHDELCAEVPDDPRYSVEELERIMSQPPAWAHWWPIRAAGWEHKRYQKD